MGGAYTAVGNGFSGVPYNPASIAFIENQESFLSRTNYVADINYSVIGYGRNISGVDFFGIHIFSLDSGPMDVTTEYVPDGTGEQFDVTGLSLRGTYAKILTDRLKFGFTIKYREDPIVLDPRNKDLGGRLMINLEKLYLSIKKLELESTKSNEYYDYSHKLGIPQIETDKLQNKLFGIECNFDELNAIDFKKGCYVGQENTARIKLKNKLLKRLLPIEIIEGQVSIDDKISINDEIFGKILINNECSSKNK